MKAASNSSIVAYPQTIPRKTPIEHTSGRNETMVEKKRRNSRSSKLNTKMTRMKERRERSEGGVIKEGEDLGDNETNLSLPPFCATCEKQIVAPNASQLFCSEACRLCDSKLKVNGTTELGEVAAVNSNR